MPRTKISEFSSTAGSNTDIDGINLAEGCAPSGINDAIRELMAQLKDFQAGTAGDSFNGPVGTTTAAAGAFTTLSATGATTLSSTLAFNNTASVPTATAFAFQPTSNAIAFGTANTERMRINSDGNVGIQNTGPSSYSAVNADNLVVGPNSGSNGITVVSGTTGTGNLAFADGAGTGGATDYAGLVQYDHNADNMNFFTGATERMRLNSSGLIAPAEVYRTTASSYLRLSGGDGVGSGANVIAFGQSHATAPGRLSLSSVGTGDIISNTISGTHIYQITGSEQMRLTSTGLGIGTSSPTYKLDVSVTGNNGIRTTSSAGQQTYLGNTGGESVVGTLNNYGFGIITNGSIRGYFDTSGNLGIGTSSPSAKLHVDSGSTGLMGLLNSTNANGGYITGRSSGSDIWDLGTAKQALNVGGSTDFGINVRNGFLSLGTGNTERMRLDSSGNLGLGVTPSAWRSGDRALDIGSTASLVDAQSANTRLYNNTFVATGGTNTYKITAAASYYDQGGGVHRWFNAASGTAGNAISFTQALTLDASGNLLLGTTSNPQNYRMHIATSSQTVLNLLAANNNNSDIFFSDTDADNRGVIRYNHTSDFMSFWSAGSERARITSGGDFLVGTTNTSASAGSGLKFIKDVNGANSSQVAIVTAASGSTTSSLSLYSTGAAAYRFYVVDSGTIYATSNTITAISDQRLKENIQDLDAGLDKIMALKPRKFDWKAGKGKDKKGDRGWIAQEFEQVFPDMVQEWLDPAPEGEEPYKAVNADLIPVLVKAMQEQQVMINELKAEVAALKAK